MQCYLGSSIGRSKKLQALQYWHWLKAKEANSYSEQVPIPIKMLTVLSRWKGPIQSVCSQWFVGLRWITGAQYRSLLLASLTFSSDDTSIRLGESESMLSGPFIGSISTSITTFYMSTNMLALSYLMTESNWDLLAKSFCLLVCLMSWQRQMFPVGAYIRYQHKYQDKDILLHSNPYRSITMSFPKTSSARSSNLSLFCIPVQSVYPWAPLYSSLFHFSIHIK